MKSTGAAYGCDWCTQKAYYGVNRQIYKISESAPLRDVNQINLVLNSDTLLLQDDTAEGLLRKSPVMKLHNEIEEFDFIWSLPLDSMHCVHMGITKRFYKMLYEDYGSKSVFASVAARDLERDRADELISNTKVPSFFARRTRTMVDSANYKSSEWQCMDMMLMPAMAMHLSEDGADRPMSFLLASWAFFVRALYYDKATRDKIEELVALDDILHDFQRQYQETFGGEQITYNMHIIRHAQESADRTGPLWKTSTSRFEASYQKVTSNYKAGTYNIGKQALQNFYLAEGIKHYCYDHGGTQITTGPTEKTNDSIIFALGRCYQVEDIEENVLMCREILTEDFTTANLNFYVPWNLVGVRKQTGHSNETCLIRKNQVQGHLVEVSGLLVEARKEWMIK